MARYARRLLSPLLLAGLFALVARGGVAATSGASDVQDAGASLAEEAGGGVTFTGTLVDLAGSSGTSAFELRIERYATDAEVAELADLSTRKGMNALQDALWEREMGYIRVDHALGYPVGLAFSRPAEEGRTVYAILDRPIQLFEIWRGLRSRDYPFSVVELRLDAEGRGEGTLYAVSKVSLRGERVLIDFLGTQPFRILEVRPQ
jgi:hypothetical protein